MQRIYDKVESRPERYELNLYITGYDEVNEETPVPVGATATDGGGESPTAPDTEGSAA